MWSRRANILAVLVLVALALTSIVVYTLHSYTTLQTTASGQQLFSQADQIVGDSIQTAIYHLMQRGYNNTAQLDAGELWYCNVAMPPNLQEVDASLQLLIQEEVQNLMQQFAAQGITASDPHITSFTASTIDDLPDDHVRVSIEDFVITRLTDEGTQSVLLEGERRYPLPAWGMLKVLDQWAQCDAGGLSQEIRDILEDRSCLMDSCCCEDDFNMNNARNYWLQEVGVTDDEFDDAIQRSLDTLQALFNGAPDCDDIEDYSTIDNVECRADITLNARSDARESQVANVCVGTYNCGFRGFDAQAVVLGQQAETMCTTHRTPLTSQLPSLAARAPSTTSPGPNVNYNRIAVDNSVTIDMIITCTDSSETVFVNNEFRPLETVVRLFVDVIGACDIDAVLNTPVTSYAGQVCVGSGGDGCPECFGVPDPGDARPACNSQGELYAPVCDDDGVFIRMEYQPCDELLCFPEIGCCDGETVALQPVCNPDTRSCEIPASAIEDACEDHDGVVGIDCDSEGAGEEDEGPGSGEDESESEEEVECVQTSDCTGNAGICREWSCVDGACQAEITPGVVCRTETVVCEEITRTCSTQGWCVESSRTNLDDGTRCRRGAACDMACQIGTCQVASGATCEATYRCGSSTTTVTGQCRSDGSCSVSSQQNSNLACPSGQVCCQMPNNDPVCMSSCSNLEAPG